MASGCSVKFRARLLALAGAAIGAMVTVLTLGHDAGAGPDTGARPASGRMTVLVPAGSVCLWYS
jgi:hypothetical protein